MISLGAGSRRSGGWKVKAALKYRYIKRGRGVGGVWGVGVGGWEAGGGGFRGGGGLVVGPGPARGGEPAIDADRQTVDLNLHRRGAEVPGAALQSIGAGVGIGAVVKEAN